MRAISSFSFEVGISTRECLAATAFRIRATMSAIGSVMLYSVKRFQIFDCRFAIEPKCHERAFQIANLKSKIANSLSPARFHHAGNLSLQRQLAKANAAQMKLTQIRARPAASLATRVSARRKLRLAIRLRD